MRQIMRSANITNPIPFFQFVLVLFVFVQQIQASLSNSGESGWFRSCEHGRNTTTGIQIEGGHCPEGVWFTTFMSPGCACVNGLWAISSSSCDKDYKLLFGNGHCFQLDQPVRRTAFLGLSSDRGNFFMPANGHIFKQIRNDQLRVPYDYGIGKKLNTTIVQIFPHGALKKFVVLEMKETYFHQMYSKAFYSSTSKLCLEMPTVVKSEPTIFVHKIEETFKSLQFVDVCPHDSNFHKNASRIISSRLLLLGDGITVRSGRPLPGDSKCPLCRNAASSRIKRSSTLTGKGYKPASPMQEQLVNEETFRLVRSELLFVLDRVKPPRHITPIWKILQKAKLVFTKVCPEVEVPSFLLNSFIRAFRYIYMSTKDSNPLPHFHEDGYQIDRIIETLDTCVSGSSPMVFHYEKSKISSTCKKKNVTKEENGTASAVEETRCQCTDKIVSVSLNQTKNESYPSQPFNVSIGYVTLPAHLAFNMTPESEKFLANSVYRDFPIETAWKMATFAHYYCGRDFRHRPSDHSAMLMRLESLFNPDVIWRWTNPGRNALETWLNFYSAFDLRKFANAVDVCLGAAKYVSQYPEWIARPTGDRKRKKRSLDNYSGKVEPEESYCLHDPLEPNSKDCDTNI